MPSLSQLYHRARHAALHRSIIRRSIMLMIFVIPGQILNFLFLIIASHILTSAAFGVLYTATSMINMLLTPTAVLALFQTRMMAATKATHGEAASTDVFLSFLKTTAIWGGAISVAGGIILSLLGYVFQVESFQIIFMIILATYFSYLSETVRAAFQGLQRFFMLGITSLSWMAIRFFLGLAAILLFNTASAGIGGIAIAALSVCVVFFPILSRAGIKGLRNTQLHSLNLRAAFPFITGLGIFSALIYADILAGYVLLDKTALGLYSGSAILPKAVILLCLPVAQVLFPVLTETHIKGDFKTGLLSLLKGCFITLLVCGFFSLAIIGTEPWICGGAYSIKNCDSDILTPLMLASIPICLLRVLVMYQLSRHQDISVLTLIIPASLYFFVTIQTGHVSSLSGFASAFNAFCWYAVAFYALQMIATEIVFSILKDTHRNKTNSYSP